MAIVPTNFDIWNEIGHFSFEVTLTFKSKMAEAVILKNMVKCIFETGDQKYQIKCQFRVIMLSETL